MTMTIYLIVVIIGFFLLYKYEMCNIIKVGGGKDGINFTKINDIRNDYTNKGFKNTLFGGETTRLTDGGTVINYKRKDKPFITNFANIEIFDNGNILIYDRRSGEIIADIEKGNLNNLEVKVNSVGKNLSFGGAIVGGIVFGGVGAILGGLRQTTTKVIDIHVVMLYNGFDMEDITLIFNAKDTIAVEKLVKVLELIGAIK